MPSPLPPLLSVLSVAPAEFSIDDHTQGFIILVVIIAGLFYLAGKRKG